MGSRLTVTQRFCVQRPLKHTKNSNGMSCEYLESKPLIQFLTVNGKFNGTNRDERTHQKTEVKIIMNRYFYSRSFCIIVPSGLLEEERPVVR